MKNKKALWITLIAVDVAVTLFLFVIHIIMLANVVGKTGPQIDTYVKTHNDLIAFLIKNKWVYLWAFVVPLFLILAGNIVALVLYVRTQTKKEQVTVDNLSDEQKEALRKELLKELAGEAEKPSEDKAEE